MSHADGCAEVIGVELERLVAIVGRVFELPLGEVADGPLIPGFGEPGSVVDERRRFADRFGILLVVVQPGHARQALLVTNVAVAPPKLPNAVVGEQAHASVTVVQGSAQGGVLRKIAHKTQGHDRRPPRHMPAPASQSLQRAQQVPLRHGLDECSRALGFQIPVIEPLEIGTAGIAHGGLQ